MMDYNTSRQDVESMLISVLGSRFQNENAVTGQQVLVRLLMHVPEDGFYPARLRWPDVLLYAMNDLDDIAGLQYGSIDELKRRIRSVARASWTDCSFKPRPRLELIGEYQFLPKPDELVYGLLAHTLARVPFIDEHPVDARVRMYVARMFAMSEIRSAGDLVALTTLITYLQENFTSPSPASLSRYIRSNYWMSASFRRMTTFIDRFDWSEKLGVDYQVDTRPQKLVELLAKNLQIRLAEYAEEAAKTPKTQE